MIGILLGVVVLIPAAVVARLAWHFDLPHGSPLHAHPQSLIRVGWVVMCIIPEDAILFLIFSYVWLVVARVVTGSDWTPIARAALMAERFEGGLFGCESKRIQVCVVERES